MRIAVVRTQVPFVTGGAERHAANLVAAFSAHGHEAVEVAIPFKWYPGGTLVDSILAAKLTDLSDFEGTPVDLMIGLKFPAYLAQHPNKVFWILHQHRQAYDMWVNGHSDLLHEPDGAAIKGLIESEDRAAFKASAAPIYANSRNVAHRMQRFLGIAGVPLYHPPPHPERFRQGAYGDYLFAPSRLNSLKRQDLMIRALALTDAPVRLVFAGPVDNPAYFANLKDEAQRLGVADRVEWRGAVDDETMLRLYAEARAVVFTPVDEDYGYIALEAMLAAKPVITVTDAGGPLEFITDEAEGLVTAPEPQALAAAFDRLGQDPAFAERMGAAGLARYRAKDIGWDSVVETLTGKRDAPAAVTEPDLRADGSPPQVPPAPDLGPERVLAVSLPQVATSTSMPPAASGSPSGSQTTRPDGAPESDALPPSAPPHTPEPEPEPDIAAIQARLRPAMPARTPFTTVQNLLDAYEFGTFDGEFDDPDGGMAAYFASHWRRYLATLALIEPLAPRRVLDVGTFPPFLFQALLANAHPGIAMEGIWEGPCLRHQRVRPRGSPALAFDLTLKVANVETDPLPQADASVDCVLGMEILEHFAIDPLYFLSEAARVLAPGGHIVLTTPNLVSHRGVLKALEGRSPYSFGIFVPTNGVYGRHNREYAPQEVARLAEAAGFETVRLLTADVYDDKIDPGIARLLTGRGEDMSLRGETILYVGRRREGPLLSSVPEGLYHGDPRQLSARLDLLGHDRETGQASIRIENTSRAAWCVEGPLAATLFLEWRSPAGESVHSSAYVPLPRPLAPGEATEVTLPLGPQNAAGAQEGSLGTATVELFQAGVGRFAGAGRADMLALPCREEAFLTLARSRAAGVSGG